MLELYILSGSAFGAVAALTWWFLRLFINDDDVRLRDRLRREVQHSPAAIGKTAVTSVFSSIGNAAARPFMPKSREKQSQLRTQLGRAGIYSASAIRVVQGYKMLMLACGTAAGYFIGLLLEIPVLGASLGGLIGYAVPIVWLKMRIASHQVGLLRAVPDALDLLVICIEAGLTLDAAMQRIGEELNLSHPALSRELEITTMETRVGVSRGDALRNLGKRTGCPALQSLSTMLIQADRFGTSIASALRVHADALRTERHHAAEELAAKASVKLSFPVVLFIFPAVLIVLAGPAVIGLFKSALFAE